MKKLLLLSAVALVAMPAQAAVLLPGAQNVAFTMVPAGTQGNRIAFSEVSGQALTFAGIFRSAVYRNTLGTLDFYYQVDRTGVGSNATDNNHEITRFTVANFAGFAVDAQLNRNRVGLVIGVGGFETRVIGRVGNQFVLVARVGAA